jgi:allantoinase
MLKSHGRYDYSAIVRRPTYAWPNGARLAVHLSLNIEHFAFGEGLGNDLAVPSPPPNHRSYAWRDYGNRVGVWNLLELADEFDLPYAILANSALYDYCPEVLAAFRKRGDEIVAHGRTNAERQTDMSLEEERRCIAEATAIIERHEGRKPLGWLAPYISQTYDSLDLLKEAGYRYMMDWPVDDQPIWFRTRHGRLLSVPYPAEMNDSIQIVSRRTGAEEFCRDLIANFDEMLRLAERRPLVMGIALHTHVLGQPYRLHYFRHVVEHILRHRERIWLTRPGEICAFVEELPPGTVP